MSYLGCYPDNLITDHPASPEFRPGRECAVTSQADAWRAECHEHGKKAMDDLYEAAELLHRWEHDYPADKPRDFVSVASDAAAVLRMVREIMGEGRAA